MKLETWQSCKCWLTCHYFQIAR